MEKKKKLQIHFVYLMELYALCNVPPIFMNEPLLRKDFNFIFMLRYYVTKVKLSLPNKLCLESSRNQHQLIISKHITQIRKER